MPYTLTSASTLGYDLVRLPGGRRAAAVVVSALRSGPAEWALLAAHHPLRSSDPLADPLRTADDAARARDLTEAWTHPATRLVIATRGGYGTQRLLPLLDADELVAAGPRWVVGFSDLTALHGWLGNRLGLATVHGPMVGRLGDGDDASREALRGLLFGSLGDRPLLTGLEPLAGPTDVPVGGVLTGGNLSLLASSVGTAAHRPATRGIAVLEEVDEPPYAVDRLLTQLLAAGWFDQVRGVVVGRLTGCGDPDVVRRVLVDRLGPLGVPVVAGADVGHEPRNLALPLGRPVVLDGAELRPGR